MAVAAAKCMLFQDNRCSSTLISGVCIKAAAVSISVSAKQKTWVVKPAMCAIELAICATRAASWHHLPDKHVLSAQGQPNQDGQCINDWKESPVYSNS